MMYKLNDRSIRIPDKEIEQNMKMLEVTQEEAIQIWLEDNEYLENTEQNELDTKAKTVKIQHEARSIKKKTQRERVQKEDPDKEELINCLKTLLDSLDFTQEVTVTNKTKMIAFKMGKDSYELNLIRKRPPKQK